MFCIVHSKCQIYHVYLAICEPTTYQSQLGRVGRRGGIRTHAVKNDSGSQSQPGTKLRSTLRNLARYGTLIQNIPYCRAQDFHFTIPSVFSRVRILLYSQETVACYGTPTVEHPTYFKDLWLVSGFLNGNTI